MNTVNLIGRLTKDPDIRFTSGELCVARFTIAIDRPANKQGEKQADYPSCIAFGKTAELIEKHFRKGYRIGVQGKLQTGSYKNKDGATIYTTDVAVEKIDFLEPKKTEVINPAADDVPQGFSQLAEDLPF